MTQTVNNCSTKITLIKKIFSDQIIMNVLHITLRKLQYTMEL